MGSPRVLVIQSHREPLPASWYARCTATVVGWTEKRGYDYRWIGDELFDVLDPALLEKTDRQKVIATDLARLVVLDEALTDWERVVWVDADVLIVRPQGLILPETGALFGREHWIQKDAAGRLKSYRKIHNAFMAFRRGDPVLPFYRYAAERILRRHDGPMTPQLIGPKLLTLFHNALEFDVLESAGVLSPLVVKDLLAGGGPALREMVRRSAVTPMALNLCGSSVVRGELGEGELGEVIERLLVEPELLEG